MAQNPVPALTMPMPNTVADSKQALNNQAVIKWALTVSPRMLAIGRPITTNGVAVPAAPNTCYLEEVGFDNITFSGSGTATLVLPALFPNGIIYCKVDTVFNQAEPSIINTIGTSGGTNSQSVLLQGWTQLLDGSPPYSRFVAMTGAQNVQFHAVGY